MDECDNHPRVISLRKAYTNSLTTTGSIMTRTIMNAITGNFLDIQSILGGSIIVDIVMGGNITSMKKVDRANNLAERITDVGLDKITRHLEPTE